MKWFYLENEIVNGPLSSEEVESKIKQGVINQEAQIWCRGQKDWFLPAQWSTRLKEAQGKDQAAIIDEKWYFAIGKEPNGPFEFSTLVLQLTEISDRSEVRVWCTGMEQWKKIYEVPRVVRELGIGRREIDRLPISGSAVVTRFEIEHICAVSTISENGIGLEKSDFLQTGDEVVLLIKCENFSAPIRTRAEVRYVNPDGSSGLTF